MRSLFLQRRFTKRESLTHLYPCNTALKPQPESPGWPPPHAAAPRAGNTQGQAVSVTASQPGDKASEKHDWSRLCCQPAAGLEIHNVPVLLPDPVTILILPHTHAAEHAGRIWCHECARTQPSPGWLAGEGGVV